MLNYRRIRQLYLKDLLDIVRDRRTLIAMTVVPIVLYPLLMLGSIQAASVQAGRLKERPLVIGVQTENVARGLSDILHQDAARLEQRAAEAKAADVTIDESNPILNFKIIVVTQSTVEDWVRTFELADCAVIFSPLPLPRDWRRWRHVKAEVVADSTEINSAIAGMRLKSVLFRYAKFIRNSRNAWDGRPHWYVNPITVDEIDVASAEKRGGGMLGQILPLILILMTMTGAIYPAIDLTAGERERGTLETLMVCPVPVIEIIMGKFLVVGSVAMTGAALNLCSMGLTLHFGGFSQALASGADTTIPLRVLPLILLFLIPLAILFSAIMLAVCSFARTFKEAQNYVTPVIIAALVPAGLAALPGSELQGVMLAMPVGNMVLLTRELLLGNADGGAILIVLLSTCLYAATAVAIAVRVFGQEAVLFADSGSWRAQFVRRLIRPSAYPKPTLPMMYVALLFPIWFYIQGGLQQQLDDPRTMLIATQVLMILCFAVMPMILVVYYKVDFANAFSLRMPRGRHLLAGVLLGLSTWALTHELIVMQKAFGLFGITDEYLKQMSSFGEELISMPAIVVIVLFAVIPGICEELLFRGLLLSGLRAAIRKWPAIIAVGLTFAVYHYQVQRFVVTVSLGMLFTYVCWQSRSVIPAIIAHLMHNGVQLLLAMPATRKGVNGVLGIPLSEEDALAHLPWHIVIPALALLALAIALCKAGTTTSSGESADSSPTRSHE